MQPSLGLKRSKSLGVVKHRTLMATLSSLSARPEPGLVAGNKTKMPRSVVHRFRSTPPPCGYIRSESDRAVIESEMVGSQGGRRQFGHCARQGNEHRAADIVVVDLVPTNTLAPHVADGEERSKLAAIVHRSF